MARRSKVNWDASGVNSGATGTVTLDTGKWTLKDTLSIGDTGNGTLTVQNGSTISNTTPVATTAHAYIGRFANSVGNATVTGANSTWSVGRSLFVGNSGMGTLHVDAGGVVISPTSGSIGELAGSVGLATINGASSKWTTNGTFYVGTSGKGTLSITSGGLVENTGLFFAAAIVGRNAGAEGNVTVSGANSKWKHGDRLEVGSSGKGTLTMDSGGTVVNVNNNDVYIGRNTGSNGTVNVGAGSTWVNSGSAGLVRRRFRHGQAEPHWRRPLQSYRTYIGNSSGSTGTVVVDAASSWTNSNELNVGYSGTGILNLMGSGVVQSTTGYLGRSTGSTGTVKVQDGGSRWANSSELYVGASGSGTLNVLSGGRVENTALHWQL